MTKQYVYTIQPSDINKPWLKFDGRVRMVSDFLGRVMVCDIGKRIYRVGDIYQIENNEQVTRRMEAKNV